MTLKKRTVFYERHRALGATLTEFAGWEMPLYYAGMTEEHLHTRSHVGIFDLCHMGRIAVSGERFREFLDWLTPAAVATAQPGRVLYSFLLNENGTVIDDITIYVGQAHAMLVVNAANLAKDLLWLQSKAQEFGGAVIADWSNELAMVAVQGPRADEVMEAVLGPCFTPLGYYTFTEISANQLEKHGRLSLPSSPTERFAVLYSATGYTGERGYEIYAPPEVALAFWDTAFGSAVGMLLRPIGLGARDSLRLEAAMPLYGHELTEETTPLEAGLAKFVDFTKEADFIGRSKLEAQRQNGVVRRLVGLEMPVRGPVPRHGYSVLSPNGQAIGHITSGVYSPSLQKNIALAYVRSDFSAVGSEVAVEIRGRLFPMQVAKKPFYKRSH